MKKKKNIKLIVFFSLFLFLFVTSILLLHNFDFLNRSALTWQEIQKGIWKFIMISAISSFFCNYENKIMGKYKFYILVGGIDLSKMLINK